MREKNLKGKKIRKLLSFLLVFTMVFCLLPMNSMNVYAMDFKYGENAFTYNDDGTITTTVELSGAGDLNTMHRYFICFIDPTALDNKDYKIDPTTHKINAELDQIKNDGYEVYAFAFNNNTLADGVVTMTTLTASDTTDNYAHNGQIAGNQDILGSGKTISDIWLKKDWLLVMGPNWTKSSWNCYNKYSLDCYLATLSQIFHVPVPTEHVHDWKFSVGTGDNSNKITAKCEGDGYCTVTNGKTNGVSLTLTATSPNYSGSAYNGASLEGIAAWTKAGLTVPTIKYYKGTDELDSVPTEAGEYTVKACLDWNNQTENNTISTEFLIKKKNWEEAPTVSVKDFPKGAYDDSATENRIKNSAGIEGSGVTYYFNTENKNEGGTVWTKTAVNQLPEGIYYAYAVFTASDSMDGVTTKSAEFAVLHNHTISSYSTDTDKNEIIGTCSGTDQYQMKAKLVAENMVYSGKAYDKYDIENKNTFEKLTGKSIAIAFYDSNNQKLDKAPMNAGTYTAEMSIDGTTKVTKTFNITKKSVTAPTAGSAKYTYNANAQTYAFANAGDSSMYTVTGNVQTNAGKHTVTVSLKDKDNTAWAGGTSEDKTFTFTIDRYSIQKPYGDPRTFVYNGNTQEYLVYSIIGSNAYNLMNIYYKLTSDSKSTKQKEVGVYNIKVEPMPNFKWADGTTTPVSYTYKILQKQMWAGIYYLEDKAAHEIVGGYVWGEYLQDNDKAANLKVSTHYTPYLYGQPAGAKTTFYVKAGNKTYNWNDLNYRDLNPGTYYVYAVVKCDGYADFTTDLCPIVVYQPGYGVYVGRTHSETVVEPEFDILNFPWVVSASVSTKKVEKDYQLRAFGTQWEACKYMYDSLKGKADYADIFSYYDGRQARYVKSNTNELGRMLGLRGSNSLSSQRLMSYSSGGLDIPDGKMPIDDEIFSYAAGFADVKILEVDTEEDVATTMNKIADHMDAKCKVTYLLNYWDGEPEKGEEYNQTSAHYKKEVKTLAIGSDPTKYVPVRDGFTFEGWYLAKGTGEDGKTPISSEGEEWTFEKDTVKWNPAVDRLCADTTLIAKWSTTKHEWKYASDENNPNVLRAVCTAEIHKNDFACNKGMPLTLSSPGPNYSGSPAVIVIGTAIERKLWEKEKIAIPTESDIKYYKGAKPLKEAPTKPGKYEARLIVGDATASLSYTILAEKNADEVAAAVDKLIKAIGTVEYTEKCKAKIDKARNAYESLTEEQKKLVKELKTLEDAEKAYEALRPVLVNRTNYDTIQARNTLNGKGKVTGITISANSISMNSVLTVNAKLKVTIFDSKWKVVGYSEDRVTPETVNTANWLAADGTKKNARLLKKYARTKYYKAKKKRGAKTLITAGLNKKDTDGVYAVKLVDDNGCAIILNIECDKLAKLSKKDALKSTEAGMSVSANVLLNMADGDSVKTISILFSGKDKNITKSAFNNNAIVWKIGKGKKAKDVMCGEVTEYTDKKGNAIGYLTVTEDGSLKVLAGSAEGKLPISVVLNGKVYKARLSVKK